MPERERPSIQPAGDWPEAHQEVKERQAAQEAISAASEKPLSERCAEMADGDLLSDLVTFSAARKDAWRAVQDDEVREIEAAISVYRDEILKRMKR